MGLLIDQQSSSSVSAQQGSVTSSVAHWSTSRAHSPTTARDNIDAFVNDLALDVGSRGGDPVGTAERQQGRARRVEGLVASVDKQLQGVSGDGNNHGGGQTQQPEAADKAETLREIGSQFKARCMTNLNELPRPMN